MLGSAWPHGAEDAIGQTGEFLVWAALVSQSGGRLHVFLPMLDRGIDGLIHRTDDGAYIAVQVKTKTATSKAEAPIALYANHLFTPDQLVVGVFLEDGRLGPYAFVADAAKITRNAARIDDRGRTMLIVDIPASPTAHHKWAEDLVLSDALSTRLGVTTRARPIPLWTAEPSPSDEDRVMGFLGEEEVCRRLAALDDCGLFRPFPDSEMVEVAVRRLATGKTVGIQVKTAQLDNRHAVRHILINRATFSATASTFVAVLAWIVPERRFHETCLVVPAADVPSVSSIDGPYYELHFRAERSREASRLDRYRVPLESLTDVISKLLG